MVLVPRYFTETESANLSVPEMSSKVVCTLSQLKGDDLVHRVRELFLQILSLPLWFIQFFSYVCVPGKMSLIIKYLTVENILLALDVLPKLKLCGSTPPACGRALSIRNANILRLNPLPLH